MHASRVLVLTPVIRDAKQMARKLRGTDEKTNAFEEFGLVGEQDDLPFVVRSSGAMTSYDMRMADLVIASCCPISWWSLPCDKFDVVIACDCVPTFQWFHFVTHPHRLVYVSSRMDLVEKQHSETINQVAARRAEDMASEDAFRRLHPPDHKSWRDQSICAGESFALFFGERYEDGTVDVRLDDFGGLALRLSTGVEAAGKHATFELEYASRKDTLSMEQDGDFWHVFVPISPECLDVDDDDDDRLAFSLSMSCNV